MSLRSMVGAAVLLLGGCVPQETMRVVPLSPAVSLPSGWSAAVGTSVRVSIEGCPDLETLRGYEAWAETADDMVALGYLSAYETIEVPDPGVPLESIIEIRLTEEDFTPVPPTEPSAQLRLVGPLGGPLYFAPISAEEAAEASGTAQLHGDMLHVMTSGLPDLDEGLFYGVWLMWSEHAHEHGGGDEGEPDEMALIGRLDSLGMLETSSEELVEMLQMVVITIETESSDGAGMSPVTVLAGELELPEREAGGGGGGHAH